MKLRTIFIILLLVLALPMASLEAKKASSKELKIERKELLQQQRREKVVRRKQQKAERKELKLQQKSLAAERREAQKAQKLAQNMEKKVLAAQTKQLRKEQRQGRASQRKIQKAEARDLRIEQRALAKQQKQSGVPPGDAAMVTRKDMKMQRKELRQEQREGRISLRSEQATEKTAAKQQKKEVVAQQRVERKTLKQEHKSEKQELKADRGTLTSEQRTVRIRQRKQHRYQRKDVKSKIAKTTVREQKARRASKQELESPKREHSEPGKKVAKEQRPQRQGHRKQHRDFGNGGDHRVADGAAWPRGRVVASSRREHEGPRRKLNAARRNIVKAQRSQRHGQRSQRRHLNQGLNQVMPDLSPVSSDWVVASRRGHGVRRDSSNRMHRQGLRTGQRKHRASHLRRPHQREHRWRRRHYRQINGHKVKAAIYVYGIFDYRPRYIYPRARTVYVYQTPGPVIVRDSVIVPGAVGGEIDLQDALSSKQEGLILQALVGSPAERENAVVGLAEFKSLASVAVLIDALINDAEVTVRAGAAVSLGLIGDAIAYEALLRSAQAELEETVRDAALAAAVAIEQLHDLQRPVGVVYPPMNRGRMELGEHLEDLRLGDSAVREDAAEELEDYHGTQVVAALIDALINDPDEDVRKEAAESLGKIGDPMALDFLKAARDSDVDEGVWKKAEKAIEKIYESMSQSPDAYRC